MLHASALSLPTILRLDRTTLGIAHLGLLAARLH